MRSAKQNLEILEQIEGLSATALYQQVQDSQEAYFSLERDLEYAVALLQEVVEGHEEEEDLSNIVHKIKEFLEEKEM